MLQCESDLIRYGSVDAHVDAFKVMEAVGGRWPEERAAVGYVAAMLRGTIKPFGRGSYLLTKKGAAVRAFLLSGEPAP